MTKKSLTELYSIAKDSLAIAEQIKAGKFSLTEDNVKRLQAMSMYVDKIKEAAEFNKLWEDATAGGCSSGAVATVVSGPAYAPIKRNTESKSPKLTPVGADGKPVKSKKSKVKEDVGVIQPVTPDEITNANNLKNTTGSQYNGTQVATALNKAKAGATLSTTDQKVLQPMLNTIGNVVSDPNSSNQFRSSATRANGINAVKVQQQKQAQQAAASQQQGTQSAIQQPNAPQNSTSDSSNSEAQPMPIASAGAQNNAPQSNVMSAESKAPKKVKSVNESSLMTQYQTFKGK